MFNKEELQLITLVLNQVSWKTGQSKLNKIAENILAKINNKIEKENKNDKH